MTLRGIGILLCCFFLVASSVSGCARLASREPKNSREVAKGDEPPIAVEIKQAFVNEDLLHVSAQLSANRNVPIDALAVTLRGIKDGETLRQTEARASSVTAQKILGKGEILHFQLSLDARELTEYQIEGSWDAAETTKRSESGSDQVVAINDLTVTSTPERCYAPPCEMLYTFNGILKNNSRDQVNSVVLGLSLNWTETGKEPVIPRESEATANEQEIVLENAALDSGESKPLRIRLDKSVPELASGKFVPHLRVLRFQQKAAVQGAGLSEQK